jgi:predicted phage baseplate assembly protein
VSGTGAAAYAIWVTCEASTFSSPPILRRLIPNAAVAQNFKNIEMRPEKINPQIENWLRLPGQTLELEVEEPEPLSEPLETSVKLSLYEIDEKWHEWRPTDHFYHHGPEDRVFVVDRPRKRLMFGNGLNGRIPVLDQNVENPAKLNYRAGGGSRGNVGQLYWTSKESGLRSYNPVPGIGGAEAETMAEAKSRVGGNLSRSERAVTASDFELLAEKTPGVAIARAHAAVGHHPGFPCHPVNGATTVFVVPEIPRDDYLFEAGKAVLAPQTDPGALAEISRLLEARRLIGSEVFVCSAQFRAVYLIVEMKGIFAGENSLQSELTLLLTRYLDPLVGGNGGNGWPFGGPLRPSSFVREIQKHVGENLFVKRVAIALDSRRNFEDCRDVAIEPYELVYLRELRLSIDRTPASRGGLR